MSRVLRGLSFKLVLCLAVLGASFGSLPTETVQPAWGNQKPITFTGTLDCGRRDGQRCLIGDTLNLWTDDMGPGGKVAIDITWIRDSLPSLDQGDFLCIAVVELSGGYQGVEIVQCKSADKVRKPQEKDDPTPTPTTTPGPTSTPTRTPTPRPTVIVDIACVPGEERDSHSPPLIASVPGGWEAGGGSALFQEDCFTPEGDDMFFEITLRSPINEQVTVQFTTQDIAGEAIGGATCPQQQGVIAVDYITTSQTVTFPPNVTLQFVQVPTCFDFDEEGDEDLRGVISNPSSNATIGIGSDIGTIEDFFGGG